MKGVETEAPMLADIDLANQRKADYVFEKQVATFLTEDELKEAAQREERVA